MASQWFGLLDGARDPAIYPLVEACREKACLFSGKLDPKLAPSLPWLVRLHTEEPLLAQWQTMGKAASWGIMVESDLAMDAVRRQLRHFTLARLPDGDVVMFRFHDPRVFRTYLASATADELAPWFDGINGYGVEDPDGSMHIYRRVGAQLLKDNRVLETAG
jgi:hypothetical protein